MCINGSLTRYVKLRVAHAPGMPGAFSPSVDFQRKPPVSDPGKHHGTCVTHVPWCMSGPLTCGCRENVPGIPQRMRTRNFTYLARGPYTGSHQNMNILLSCKIWTTNFAIVLTAIAFHVVVPGPETMMTSAVKTVHTETVTAIYQHPVPILFVWPPCPPWESIQSRISNCNYASLIINL